MVVEAAWRAEPPRQHPAVDLLVGEVEIDHSVDVVTLQEELGTQVLHRPHHQGAVEMAKLELLHGHDPRLRRLAQGIVVEQSQEIALLRSVLASPSAALGTDLDP